MIARVWRGVARTEEADAYVRHLQNDTFPALAGDEKVAHHEVAWAST